MQAAEDLMQATTGPVETFKVLMLGGPGVGKTALLSQFTTSECINAYETGRGNKQFTISHFKFNLKKNNS